MVIYVIKHPQPGFKGCIFGVDFHDGKGSSSDQTQVCDLLDLAQGYKVSGQNGPLSEEQKVELEAFRAARQPFRDAQKAFAKPLPKTGGWILP